MADGKINVLVYTGNGAAAPSIHHTLYTLNRLLPNYAITPVSADTLLNEPWPSTCALLVFPGGADVPYCQSLNGSGNHRIRQYVNSGGRYLGFCAGGYYGCSKCEFEVGHETLEVIGSRELGFFSGTCRGSAFEGFRYRSESGTRAAALRVEKLAFAAGGLLPDRFRAYANGGGVFVDADEDREKGVEVLTRYADELNVDDAGKAAVISCTVGDGLAVLTGPHPEFAAANFDKEGRGFSRETHDALEEDDKLRQSFMKACLLKLGLRVNQNEESTPQLTPLYFSSISSDAVKNVKQALEKEAVTVDDEKYLRCEQDLFHVQSTPSVWSVSDLKRSAKDILQIILSNGQASDGRKRPSNENPLGENQDVVLNLVFEDGSQSYPKKTPYFNNHDYFASLREYASGSDESPNQIHFGENLIYAEVVTSTSTLLEKNPKLTSRLPSGTVFTATRQLSGRGRGSNVWVSPAGSLMFSTVFSHPLSLNAQAPVVFVQYLAALAVAEGVLSYDGDHYDKVPVKLKWPNDIYALNPKRIPGSKKSSGTRNEEADPEYVKIGGILVNSSYSGGDYTLILGIGLNVSNAAPTTSLNALVEALNQKRVEGSCDNPLKPFSLERLLARILSKFSSLYATFKRRGFAGEIQDLYYKHWLHSGQVVTLETEGGAKARIKGVTSDWGLLLAEGVMKSSDEKDEEWRSTGKQFALQTDSNSFDFMKGLVKRKL